MRIPQISIHVPLAGNVSYRLPTTSAFSVFLSTFPLRGTSRAARERAGVRQISIHVPLAGNVRFSRRAAARREISIHVPLAGNVVLVSAYRGLVICISIHVPLAGNVSPPAPPLGGDKFLSTFPLRGTSALGDPALAPEGISIHVPLAGNVRI